MRGMNSESIDLIYLDPPFNSKRNYAAPIGSKAAGAEFKDTWTLDDLDVEWINLIGQKHPALRRVLLAAMTNSDKSYLAYMAVRILEMRRILKPTGSIYLHCDPTMSHYLKLVMDSIFGKKNFRNEIVWCYHAGGASKKHFPRKHDLLLLYGKDASKSFHNVVRGILYRDIYAYDANGNVNAGYHPEGKMMPDWWEISQISSVAKERIGYPTQKPLALLDRIIKASSDSAPPPPRLFSTHSAGVRRRWWRPTVCNGNGLAWMCQRKRPSWWSSASRKIRGCSIPSFIARTYRRGQTWDACPYTIASQTKRSCTATRAEIVQVAKLTSKNRFWKSTISSRRARGEQTTLAICNCYAPHAIKSKATVAWST